MVRVMALNATLLVGETRVPGKNLDLPQVTDKLYHIMLYQIHLTLVGFKLIALVVINTECIGSCKFNYHMITNTTAPNTLCCVN